MTAADLARILAASYRPRRHAGRMLPTCHPDGNVYRAGNRKSAYLLMTELRKRGHRCTEETVKAALEGLRERGLVSFAVGGYAVISWDELRAAGAA